jgi:nicotinate-nucleotide adenylyltransferase
MPAPTQIFAIVGADALLSLPQWRGVTELFRLAEWVVVSRPGFSLDAVDKLALTAAQRSHLHFVEGLADPTSATQLRARLHAGDPCEDLLDPAVSRYIRAHGLYGAGKNTVPDACTAG